jgi:hypothetical protein
MTIRCPQCRRRFAPPRRDAVYCSAKCRVAAWRHRVDKPEAIRDAVAPAPAPVVSEISDILPTSGDSDEPEAGWRRVGRYVIPPADPRHTFFVDPNQLRRP